jgi:hypothetical protein
MHILHANAVCCLKEKHSRKYVRLGSPQKETVGVRIVA